MDLTDKLYQMNKWRKNNNGNDTTNNQLKYASRFDDELNPIHSTNKKKKKKEDLREFTDMDGNVFGESNVMRKGRNDFLQQMNQINNKGQVNENEMKQLSRKVANYINCYGRTNIPLANNGLQPVFKTILTFPNDPKMHELVYKTRATESKVNATNYFNNQKQYFNNNFDELVKYNQLKSYLKTKNIIN